MDDAPGVARATPAAQETAAPGRPRRWRHWLSAGLFALVVLCFVLPFASTSCTLPGGYGRGAQGTSTVYRGVDLAFGSVPAVTPGDRPPRPGSSPDDGRLGVQPFALLALLAALAGIGLAWTRGAGLTAALAGLDALLLVVAQLVAVGEIAGRVDSTALPGGRSQTDYVNTGQGFLLALLLLAVVAAVNVGAVLWQARRARPPG